MSGLGQSGVTAVKWSAVSTLARFVLQLVAQVVLARTLGPEIFGIFAIGMVVLTFANFFSGFGFSWSLLQRTSLCDEDVRFAWTWQLVVGLVTMIGVYFLAPALADYFREPRAQSVIEWLSIACLLSAASAPATYLLQRDLNFRAGGLIQVGSYMAGYVAVGVPMAILGWGATSLVAAWLVQAAVVLVASYVVKPHPLRPLFWYADAASAVGTGRAVFLTNIVNWMLNNLDRVMIGRLLNTQALGLYNVAYNLAAMPNNLLLGALQPAFLAAGARLQDERERLGRAYLQMLATIFVLVFPVFVFLALVSNDLIKLLYGSKWSDAGTVLGLLFMSMPAYVIWGLSTPVLWNTGRKYYESLFQLPILVIGALGFYFFADQGIQVAASVAALMLVLRSAVVGTTAFRALKLSWIELLPDVGRGILFSSLCAITVKVTQTAVSNYQMPLLSLAASILAALSILLLLLFFRPQLLGVQSASMVVRFFPGLAQFLSQDGLGIQRSPIIDSTSEQRF
ncbi:MULTISPECIES: lipopolysaccharide biosynthesis protein [unclassified Polaromonas]|uniref:lipopolysaccharide biosynthesis protein n=1 Tax=unclassified Polaromonas TaxID=2638319 RepID=UPI0018CABB41|nr:MULTISPECIES: lipopolysaccharide biosynthesis protein [unclassified Polaromonas]MBG6072387.1 O-antigen/teichoic acid export membrane protein [Polaromonas sp. CG_9.7]MBG6114391.1 O-antigen/teichoic acid export membrane protein [Polaromonas sp. CG_9.2]MDH6185345.1 O-antigen/teichoic acid export membrane protein [Polaromonas sp. CG_23.6]